LIPDGLHALADDRLGEQGRGGRAVTSLIGSRRCDFLDHLCAHVLELVLQLDLFRDRDAILRDGRRAEALFEHCVAALRAERRFDGIREQVDAADQAGARVV
jgi:hypothetical protein